MSTRIMLRWLAAFTLVVLSAAGASAQTTNLIISEYVEGSANNKAIEIHNGTQDVISLGAYRLDRYSNGSATPFAISLPATNLAPGATHVIVFNLADASLLAHANQVDTNLNFNGNDALVLVYGTNTVIDSIGRVGEDPGTAWTCSGGGTANLTMRRVSSVCAGDTNPSDAFNPCSGWVFFAIDTFSGLGSHITDCGAVPDEGTSWGGLKATFR